MHVGNTRRKSAADQQNRVGIRMPILVCRVMGSFGMLEIYFACTRSSSDDGPSLLVERVLLDGLPHDEQILLQRGFLGAQHRFFIARRRDTRQDQDDRDDDHHFQASVKPAAANAASTRTYGSACISGIPEA